MSFRTTLHGGLCLYINYPPSHTISCFVVHCTRLARWQDSLAGKRSFSPAASVFWSLAGSRLEPPSSQKLLLVFLTWWLSMQTKQHPLLPTIFTLVT
jgi:hypothetical protein